MVVWLKKTLLSLKKQLVMEQPLQHPIDVPQGGKTKEKLLGLRKNENVVEEHNHKNVQHLTEDVIEQRLEDSVSIGVTEGQY